MAVSRTVLEPVDTRQRTPYAGCMTTVRIDLPDAQAAALQAKAAAQGLSLEEWFRKIAGQEASVNGEVSPRKSAYGLLAQYGPGPSEEEIDDNRKDMSRGFAEDAP